MMMGQIKSRQPDQWLQGVQGQADKQRWDRGDYTPEQMARLTNRVSEQDLDSEYRQNLIKQITDELTAVSQNRDLPDQSRAFRIQQLMSYLDAVKNASAEDPRFKRPVFRPLGR